jgi:LysM repeat protein
MKKLAFGLLIGSLVVLMGLAGLMPVQAAPLTQSDIPTPTAGFDGNITYTVQSGDTLYDIFLWTGVSVDDLRALNGMGENDALIAGTTIIVGTAEPYDVQPGYTGLPTSTPINNSASVCALLYLDVNGDANRQPDEIAMAEGVVSVIEQTGLYSQQGITTYSLDSLCFSDLPPGTYDISITLPAGYYRTTDLSATLALAAGDTAFLSFGMTPDPNITPVPSGREDTGNQGGGGVDPILIVGALLLVVGAGAGIYAAIANRGTSSEGD